MTWRNGADAPKRGDAVGVRTVDPALDFLTVASITFWIPGSPRTRWLAKATMPLTHAETKHIWTPRNTSAVGHLVVGEDKTPRR
jgi:hypothetical protein